MTESTPRTEFDRLRQEIRELKTPNWRKQEFIPFKGLCNALQNSNLIQVLRDCRISADKHQEIKHAVQNGGKRVFAILLELDRLDKFVNFMGQDHFLHTTLDSRLPYEEAPLERIIPSDYRDFFDTQWAYSSPLFTPDCQHRIFHKRCVLPFIEVINIAEGGFGYITKATLPDSHHDFAQEDGQNVTLIRKTLSDYEQKGLAFRHELDILGLLRCLRHPNIIKLYTAYTIPLVTEDCDRGLERTLLFEPADGDLDQLLSGSMQSVFDRKSIFRALYDLSLAIVQFHNFSLEGEDLELIGCHYDLKPKNILVKGRRFLLSDFGLSRMKTIEKGSDSIHKLGPTRYSAPESMVWEGEHGSLRTRRPSDIWSLGCVLAEIVTYMEKGANGIREFFESRRINVGYLRPAYTFHGGSQTPNNGVMTWMANLGNNLERNSGTYESSKGLLHLCDEPILRLSKYSFIRGS
ncbi:kinase-like domain-containing protein [Rostrohypoxylon terebratum]|nr:kinase-like domain-containing protein [Rostrohypoxylon terebratum]